MGRRQAGAWIGLGLSVLLAGCGDPALDAHLARRAQNRQATFDHLNALERGRADKLASTLEMLEQRHRRDVALNAANPGHVQDWLQRDIDRWIERQSRYPRAIEHQVEGDIPNIERTVPLIFY